MIKYSFIPVDRANLAVKTANEITLAVVVVQVAPEPGTGNFHLRAGQ